MTIIILKLIIFITLFIVSLTLPYYIVRVVFKKFLKFKWAETKPPALTIQSVLDVTLIINAIIVHSIKHHHYYHEMHLWDFILLKEFVFIPISYAIAIIIFIIKIKLNYANQLFKYSIIMFLSFVPYWTLITYFYTFYYLKIFLMQPIPMK